MADLVVGGSLGAGYQRPDSFDFPSIVPGLRPFYNLREIFFGKFHDSHSWAFGPPVNYEKFMPALAPDFEL
jgi:hypothetical protein